MAPFVILQREATMRQQVFVKHLERSKALFYYALVFLVMSSFGSIQIVQQFLVDGFYWLGVVNIVGGLMVNIAGLRASNTTNPNISFQGVFASTLVLIYVICFGIAHAYLYFQLTGPRQMTINGQTMDASLYYASQVMVAVCSTVIYTVALLLNRRRHKLVTEHKAHLSHAIKSALD